MAELPILHSKRAVYDWVERLRVYQEAYEREISVDPERAERDAEGLDAQLVYNSLRLKGVEIDLDAVLAARRGADATDAATSGALQAIARVRTALHTGEAMTPELLLEINGLLDTERGGRLRSTPPVAAYQGHSAPGPEALDRLLVNAAEWFTVQSFVDDFHPVEQSALALIRICDLQPFPTNNELTARIAASFFTLRAGLPPVIVHYDLEQDYRKAILHAMHMDTQLIVDLLARCVEMAFADLGVVAR